MKSSYQQGLHVTAGHKGRITNATIRGSFFHFRASILDTSLFDSNFGAGKWDYITPTCTLAKVELGQISAGWGVYGWVTNLWLACHKFEPSSAEDPQCRVVRCELHMLWLNCYPIGVVWKLGDGASRWIPITTLQFSRPVSTTKEGTGSLTMQNIVFGIKFCRNNSSQTGTLEIFNMDTVDILHHDDPPTWGRVEPENLGVQGQPQTYNDTQSTKLR
ncbi:hypothetical protein TNCV_2850721 [Trichonephila clavipes]|nr:hypothetical protein TNCV_2850721 [Trichonephila clavipes]